jgi:hypothetical protein
MTVSVPLTIDEALALLRDAPGSTVLAGGTDLMVEINSGHREVGSVVAVDRIPALREWRVADDRSSVWIGSGVPYSVVMADPLAGVLPALAQASRTVGSPQIRHVGTIGGNLGTCSPAGDTLPVLAALEATVHLQSVEGSRTLAFGDFMTGVKRTARRPDELITGITVPVLDGWQGYSKVGVRNAMVIATASSCVAVDAATRSVRAALGSVGPVIIRCTDAETWVSGQIDWGRRAVADDVAAEFGRRCAAASRPIDDHRSTAAYRRKAIEVLTSRQLRRAFPGG